MKPLRHLLLPCLLLAAPAAQSQNIVDFHVPTDICAGHTETVSFGYRTTHNVVVQSYTATLGHSERVFLPDGQPCGNPPTCVYHSPVTFSSFPPNSTVSSVNDIKYVRLNMEHSYAADIYISITCPSGQRATIMRFGGTDNSACAGELPSGIMGWSHQYGLQNASGDSYFGWPVDNQSTLYPCDSSAHANRPGTGWNYCWSSNTNSGYQYATSTSPYVNDDGIIYRKRNTHRSFDSSNVALGRNFYHPDQSFSALVGCPLNGEWAIDVVDGYSQDNGYIFEWDLALDATLIPPQTCYAESYAVVGPGVGTINDSTFSITAPPDLQRDTAITYTFRIYNTCGETVDTTAVIRLHPNRTTTEAPEGCDRVNWRGRTYTRDTTFTTHHTTSRGCDSTYTLAVTIHPSYLAYRADTVVENALPVTFGGHTYTEATEADQISFRSAYGCDSTIIYSLTVHPNKRTATDTSVCDNELPYRWNGRTYNAPADDTLRLHTTDGADSTVTLHLTVRPTYDTSIALQVTENTLPVFFSGQRYDSDTTLALPLTSALGCDSTVHFSLAVFRNQHVTLERTVCDALMPYYWDGATFDRADTISLTHLDVHGADSVVTLILHTFHSYDTTVVDSVCENLDYHVGTQRIDRPGLHVVTLTSSEGCDSIVRLHLTMLPYSEEAMADTVCASEGYLFAGDSCDHSGTYSHTFANQYGCDSLVTLQLTLLAQGLQARLKAMPEIATVNDPEVRLYDLSHQSVDRQWTLDEYTSNQRDIVYRFADGQDSLEAVLVAYSSDGCTDTARRMLYIDRAAVIVPNAFTPGEATNRTWAPFNYQIDELEIYIYNRQGLLVRHLQGTDSEWDGTDTDGALQPQGVYVYTLTYRTAVRPDREQNATGTILLIR